MSVTKNWHASHDATSCRISKFLHACYIQVTNFAPVSFGLILKNQNQIQIDFEFDFHFTIWKMGDDINLLDALAVAEGIKNVEVVDNQMCLE